MEADFKKIAENLLESEKVSLFPHMNMDGDALGSCVALALGLRQLGKEAYIVINEDIPANLSFLDDNLCVTNQEIAFDADVALLVDCGELKRIKGREEIFASAKSSICIDHHGTSGAICDLNWVDPEAAATGQLVFRLLNELGVKGNKQIGEALYASIVTDTGRFQFSNTQKESHEIVAELYDWGIDHNKVAVAIYDSKRIERVKMENRIISEAEFLFDGRAAIAVVTQNILKETGAIMNETESVVDMLRAVKGVEVVAFLKEESDEVIRVSLRSKEWFDVAELASVFDGGGHIRASGYTDYCTLGEALAHVKKEIAKRIESR